MRKIKLFYIFSIIIITMFFCILNTYALDINKLNELKLTIGKNDNVCVYKKGNNNNIVGGSVYDYVVLVFQYNSQTNKYEVINYTGSLSDISMHVEDYTSKNCDDYSIWVNEDSSGVFVNISDNNYKYKPDDDNLYTLYEGSEITVERTESNLCTLTSNGKEISFGSYNQNGGKLNYFIVNNQNKKVCPATTSDGGMTFERKKIDGNFVCSNWKIIENLGTSNYDIDTCAYFIIDKNEEIYRESSQVKEVGQLITTYKEYNNSNSSTIRIIKNNDNTYKAIFPSGEEITSISSDTIKTEVIDKESYPKFLIKAKGSDVYKFVDDRKNLEFDNIYINQKYLNIVQGLGEEEIYSTCKDIFGGTFLTFLEENVFGVVRIGVIILLILLTTFDFAKVVFVDDKEGIQNAFKNFKRRAIAAVLIFLTPTIIILIANLVGAGESVQDCAKTIRSMSTQVSENE